MPTTTFFATKSDLAPRLDALQKERPLQFVRCWAGGWLDSPSLPTYNSLLEATDLDHLQYRTGLNRGISRLDLAAICVLDAGVSVSVEEKLIGEALPEGGTVHYRVVIPDEAPWVLLTPGGLQDSPPVLWCGQLQASYSETDEICLYRQVMEALFKGFKRFGSYFYGPEALAFGASGVPYAYLTDEPYKPWTYNDLMQGEQNAAPLPDKPANGRLSLEASWDWLESYGYEVPRNADGTPYPYRRRPRYSDSLKRGFDISHTSIDESELDHLTIPRTYIGESRGYETLFKQSDLSGSRFADNHWAYCDFTEADFTGALLADFFLSCKFDGAILTQADLRHSAFEDCTFAGAKMEGAQMLREQAQQIALTPEQEAEIVWRKAAGPTPPEF